MGYPCNEYILKALNIADELMSLANNGDTLRDDTGCGILFSVMRDCAYKVRREAEREREAHKAKGKCKRLKFGTDVSEIQQVDY